MLVHLHVKNLALIEDIEVEFGPGLNNSDVVRQEQVNRFCWVPCS